MRKLEYQKRIQELTEKGVPYKEAIAKVRRYASTGSEHPVLVEPSCEAEAECFEIMKENSWYRYGQTRMAANRVLTRMFPPTPPSIVDKLREHGFGGKR